MTEEWNPPPCAPQNIVMKLRMRELQAGRRRCGMEMHFQRRFYQSVFPNTSVHYVTTPTTGLRDFTPDGKRLIAFGRDAKCVEIYTFKGPQAAGTLFIPEVSIFLPVVGIMFT